jgi:hypothetical protein
MKKIILVAAGAVLIAGLAASWQPAEANCGNARILASRSITGETYLFTPGGPHQGANFPDSALNDPRGQFWSAGYGNPTGVTPPNNDSGTNAGETGYYNDVDCAGGGACAWLENQYDGFGAFVEDNYAGASHWNTPGTDGCIDFDGADGNHNATGLPDTNQCSVILVDDDDDNGGGFFLLAAQGPDSNGTFNYYFNEGFGHVDTVGNVNLAPIPVPRILSSSSVSAFSKNLTVVVDCPIGPAAGVYNSCSPAESENAQLTGAGRIGYRLYSATTAPNVIPTGVDSRDLPSALPQDDDGNPTGWAAHAGGFAACGQPVNINVSCSQNSFIHLCTSLVFDDPLGTGAFDPEWETTTCSSNAVPIGCGPDMADPSDPILRHDRKPDPADRGAKDRDRNVRGGR